MEDWLEGWELRLKKCCIICAIVCIRGVRCVSRVCIGTVPIKDYERLGRQYALDSMGYGVGLSTRRIHGWFISTNSQ